MMEHTPGPWNLDEEIWAIDDDAINPGQIASVSPRPGRAANAHLIAAAPDLLEECKYRLKAMLAACQSLKAVIDKAEGR